MAAMLPCRANADNPPDTYAKDYIAVLPGGWFPSKALDTTGTGATVSGIYGYQFTPHWSGEFNLLASEVHTHPYAGVDYQTGFSVDAIYQLRERSAGLWTPFLLAGVGPTYNSFYPNTRDGAGVLVEAGLGAVTQPLFHGVRLRADLVYARDSREAWHQEPRANIGIEIPLGRIEHRIEYVKVEREVPVERVIVKDAPVVPDSDGDGVDDAHDKCPNTPPGMRVDAQGCVIEDQVVKLEGVHFEFNKTRITRDAATVLDRLAPTFVSQPTLKAEIDGHTDLKGSEASNLTLSQKRAEAVRAYLIAHGVRPEQLTARGFGKSHPLIAPEHDEADAERNRRVELRVLAR